MYTTVSGGRERRAARDIFVFMVENAKDECRILVSLCRGI